MDAAILTGYGLYGNQPGVTFGALNPRIARLQQSRAFHAYDFGYVTNADLFNMIYAFFKAPDYDRAIARFAEATKAPFSLFEALSLSSTPAPAFRGPVLVASGEFDLPFCSGYCPGVLANGLDAIFPRARGMQPLLPSTLRGFIMLFSNF